MTMRVARISHFRILTSAVCSMELKRGKAERKETLQMCYAIHSEINRIDNAPRERASQLRHTGQLSPIFLSIMSNIAIANRNDNGRRVLFCIGEKSTPLLPVCEVKLLGWRGEYAARKITSRSTNRVFADSTSKVGQTPARVRNCCNTFESRESYLVLVSNYCTYSP